MHGLESATGFIQAEVAKRLQTRFTPALKFISDEGVKKSIEITRLIREGLGQKDEEPVTSENEVVKNEVEGEFEDEFEDEDEDEEEDDTEDGDNLDESPTNHDNRP
jgi:ribosome-binding factor A